MGDLFLDIDNTIFHVLLKQGVGEKYFAGDIFIIILQFYQFSIFFLSLLFFGFFLVVAVFLGGSWVCWFH